MRQRRRLEAVAITMANGFFARFKLSDFKIVKFHLLAPTD